MTYLMLLSARWSKSTDALDAALARNSNDPLHRATENADLPPGGETRLRRGTKTRDIRGEGRDNHPALRVRDEARKRRGDVALRRAFALA